MQVFRDLVIPESSLGGILICGNPSNEPEAHMGFRYMSSYVMVQLDMVVL